MDSGEVVVLRGPGPFLGCFTGEEDYTLEKLDDLLRCGL